MIDVDKHCPLFIEKNIHTDTHIHKEIEIWLRFSVRNEREGKD